jgi:hypothetical protein
MSRGDFNCPSAKAKVNRLISHNRYYPVHCGKDNLFTEHSLEPLIFRINGYRSITKYGLRSGGGYGDKTIIFSQMVANIV